MKTALKSDSGQTSSKEDDVEKQQDVTRMPSFVRYEQNRKQLEIEPVDDCEPESGAALDYIDAPAKERSAAEKRGQIEPTTDDEANDDLHISDELFDRAIRAAGKVLARS